MKCSVFVLFLYSSAGLRVMQSPSPITHESILATAKKIEATFVNMTSQFDKGVDKRRVLFQGMQMTIPTESFALVSAAITAEVDIIIESGTAYGSNTEMMAQFFDDRPHMQIYSVDNCCRYGSKQCKQTAKRLKKFPNVKCLYPEDSLKTIPKLVTANKGKRIGIFVDGPKARKAVTFCQQLIQSSADVKFCGIHDMHEGEFLAAEHQDYALLTSVSKTEGVTWHDLFKHLDKNTPHEGYQDKPQGNGLAIIAGQETTGPVKDTSTVTNEFEATKDEPKIKICADK